MKPTPWEAVSCVIVALAVIVALSYSPPTPEPQWRDPAVELPADTERVMGVYPVRGNELIMVRVEYQIFHEKGLEYWVEYCPEVPGGGPGWGRPYRWAPLAEAERMELPEVPDLYLKAMVERRYK